MKPSNFLSIALSAMTCLCRGTVPKGSAQQPSSGKPKPPVPQLIVAVRDGDHARIKELLAQGMDPNVLDPGVPPLSSMISAWGWAFLVGDAKGFALFPTKDVKISPIEASAGLTFAAVSGNTAFAKVPLEKVETPDGRVLAVPLGSWNRGGPWAALRLFNLERTMLEAETPVYAPRLKPVTAATFSPDGKRLVAAYGSGMIKLWDVDRPQWHRFTHHGCPGL